MNAKVKINADLYVEMQKEAEKYGVMVSDIVAAMCKDFLKKGGKSGGNNNNVRTMRKRQSSRQKLQVFSLAKTDI